MIRTETTMHRDTARRAREQFQHDVVRGLRAPRKELSPKYFYDRTGSLLFDAICDLPEYYLTRTELGILEATARDIVAGWGPRVRVVEPGAGSGEKTRLILRALGSARCAEYVPIDIAADHLADAASRLASELPWLPITPIHADFATDFVVPPLSQTATAQGVRTVVYFPGSTLGNFAPEEASGLLAAFRRAAGPGGSVVLGLDLKKDPSTLHAAYNDAEGVTAAFNKNLLVRMNRELGADFDLSAFAHYAFYAPEHGRIEMHLVSLANQVVHVGGHTFPFAEGESVRTECSYKYDLAMAERMAQRAGLCLGDVWQDEHRRFAIVHLHVNVGGDTDN